MVYKTFLFSAPADATNEECPRPDTPGEEADHDHHQGQDLLQPEDLSLKRPEARECLIKTEAEAGKEPTFGKLTASQLTMFQQSDRSQHCCLASHSYPVLS